MYVYGKGITDYGWRIGDRLEPARSGATWDYEGRGRGRVEVLRGPILELNVAEG